MNEYRRGTILGLTIAETFVLLTFLLLVALLGLVSADDASPVPDAPNAARVWVRPEEIETLVGVAERARKAQEVAEQALAAAQRERDRARESADEARKAQEEAERALATAERERGGALKSAGEARKAQEEAEQALIAVERERDRARGIAGEAREAQKDAEQAREIAERERDEAQHNLALLNRKGKNPPCWYQIVSAGEGKTREKPHYVFDVAIYETSIELAPRTPPRGGAVDDGGGLYEEEWAELRIEELPYGKELSDQEFIGAVSDLVARGRNRQVRTYECVFSVMVWDETPDHAKARWKDAHDRIIEGFFSAYTVRDLEWRGVEP